MSTITISGKALGKKKPLFADWSIPFPPDWGDGDHLTLRELITRIVLTEVAAFKERQQERRVARVLSVAEIERGMDRGKVDSGGSELEQEVDEQTAVATALEAFEDGLYLVVIDGEEQRELDAQVYLRPDSRVTFVRLVFLAGA
jgi:hypothetical protein